MDLSVVKHLEGLEGLADQSPPLVLVVPLDLVDHLLDLLDPGDLEALEGLV